LTVYTIGYTRKPLRRFIELLRGAGVDAVIDVRLRNTGQLAGWSKRDDLAFILEAFGIAYHHRPEVAPTPELLDGYRRDHDWERYEVEYPRIIAGRAALPAISEFLSRFERPCLLCSEHEPTQCHRRLLCQLVAGQLPLQVVHLQ